MPVRRRDHTPVKTPKSVTQTITRQFRYDCADATVKVRFSLTDDELPERIEHELDHVLVPGLLTLNSLGCLLSLVRPSDVTKGKSTVSDRFEQKLFGVLVRGQISAKMRYVVEDDSNTAEDIREVLRAVVADFIEVCTKWIVDEQRECTNYALSPESAELRSLIDFINASREGTDMSFVDFLRGGRAASDTDLPFDVKIVGFGFGPGDSPDTSPDAATRTDPLGETREPAFSTS